LSVRWIPILWWIASEIHIVVTGHFLKFDYVGLIANDSFGLQINLYCMTVIVIIIIIIIQRLL